MIQQNDKKILFSFLILGLVSAYIIKSSNRKSFVINNDDKNRGDYNSLDGIEEAEIVEDFYIKDIEEGKDFPEISYPNPMPLPPPIFDTEGDLISFVITNTTNGVIPISLFGNDFDRMDTANATTRYFWDVTSINTSTDNTIALSYKWIQDINYTTINIPISVNTLQGICDTLNTLNLGAFFLTTEMVSTNSIVNTSFVYGSGFSSGIGFNSNVNAIGLQSDGKILCGGEFALYQGVARSKINRINIDGSIDLTFAFGVTQLFVQSVITIAIQSDDKILCGGDFSQYDLTPANKIIRLNANGSIDGTFVYGSGFNNFVQKIKIQSDGKILCVGFFTTYQGTSVGKIIRLNTNGSRDRKSVV